MAMRADRRGGFSLVEIVVVMTIVTMLFGLGLPGLISAQRRLDSNNTLNVITAVHNACLRNARQVGASGVIYGFTLDYSDTSIGTAYASIRIVPWVKAPLNSFPSPDGFPTKWEAFGAVGGTVPWDSLVASPPTITFVDQLLPADRVEVSNSLSGAYGSHTGVGIGTIRVAYEPGTGFVHVTRNISSSINLGAGGEMEVGKRTGVVLTVWNKKQKRAVYKITISAIGTLDVKNA